MKSFLGISLFVGVSLLSTSAHAVTADGNGTHKSSFIEGTFTRHQPMTKAHIHKSARAAAILTYHEGVNPAIGDQSRELRRLDEKNNRGRALR